VLPQRLRVLSQHRPAGGEGGGRTLDVVDLPDDELPAARLVVHLIQPPLVADAVLRVPPRAPLVWWEHLQQRLPACRGRAKHSTYTAQIRGSW